MPRATLPRATLYVAAALSVALIVLVLQQTQTLEYIRVGSARSESSEAADYVDIGRQIRRLEVQASAVQEQIGGAVAPAQEQIGGTVAPPQEQIGGTVAPQSLTGLASYGELRAALYVSRESGRDLPMV